MFQCVFSFKAFYQYYAAFVCCIFQCNVSDCLLTTSCCLGWSRGGSEAPVARGLRPSGCPCRWGSSLGVGSGRMDHTRARIARRLFLKRSLYKELVLIHIYKPKLTFSGHQFIYLDLLILIVVIDSGVAIWCVRLIACICICLLCASSFFSSLDIIHLSY